MKVNNIINTYTPKSFNSNLLSSSSSNTPSTQNKRSSYVKTGLIGMSIIGAAGIISSFVKEKNTSPVKILKKVSKRILHKPETDIIAKRLQGRRDEEARMLYEAYTAKRKTESLLKKYFNGDFSPEVMPYIRANNRDLQRMASSVL